jgi:hypothetical protein
MVRMNRPNLLLLDEPTNHCPPRPGAVKRPQQFLQ